MAIAETAPTAAAAPIIDAEEARRARNRISATRRPPWFSTTRPLAPLMDIARARILP